MLYDIRNFIPDFSTEEEEKSGFKKTINDYLGCKYNIPVSNGTVAIEIALKSLGIPRGSLVVVPDLSFIATATAVANCGLIPVFTDVSEDYFGMTLKALETKYTRQVKAVIVVHLGGYMNREIFEIRDFCREKGIYLLEDCAQALACTAMGQKAGTIGDIGTFSFQSSKIINSGEGGLIVTNDREIAIRCEAVSNWGLYTDCEKRNLEISSSNYRLSAIQCYFLKKQFEMIDDIVEERLSKYDDMLRASCKYNFEPYYPKKYEGFFDCPFYFMVKCGRKHYTIEPREEYPMRKSGMVKEILNTFYPDLVEKYMICNTDNAGNLVSARILNEIDFINILQYSEKSYSELFSAYADQAC